MSVEDETWDRPLCGYCGKPILYGQWEAHKAGHCKHSVPDTEQELVRVCKAVRQVLARLEEREGSSYWTEAPATDLQEAAQKLAAILPPDRPI